MDAWIFDDVFRGSRREIREALLAFVVSLVVTYSLLASGALTPMGVPSLL